MLGMNGIILEFKKFTSLKILLFFMIFGRMPKNSYKFATIYTIIHLVDKKGYTIVLLN